MSFRLRGLIASLVMAATVSLPSQTPAQTLPEVRTEPRPLTLESQGSFFVGGEVKQVQATGWSILNLPFLPERGGTMVDGQMYVQYQRPVGWKKRWPIVFMHGCCLTSKTWETTPDGRMGWYEYFTRKGYATYLADQVGRGRSALAASVINEVHSGTKPPSAVPPVGLATRELIWRLFRFGPEVGQAWPDQQFPMTHIDEFMKQIVPDFIMYQDPSGFTFTDQADLRSPSAERLATLANELGGAILVGHSQSAGFPAIAALMKKGGIKGIVQLEIGCFVGLTDDQAKTLARVPILVLVGDHYPSNDPPKICVDQMKAVNAAGGDMTFVALPSIGIKGNSHMMMQDRNNLQVADVVMRWIAKHVPQPK